MNGNGKRRVKYSWKRVVAQLIIAIAMALIGLVVFQQLIRGQYFRPTSIISEILGSPIVEMWLAFRWETIIQGLIIAQTSLLFLVASTFISITYAGIKKPKTKKTQTVLMFIIIGLSLIILLFCCGARNLAGRVHLLSWTTKILLFILGSIQYALSVTNPFGVKYILVKSGKIALSDTKKKNDLTESDVK